MPPSATVTQGQQAKFFLKAIVLLRAEGTHALCGEVLQVATGLMAAKNVQAASMLNGILKLRN